jgi:hypothetical protein
MPPRRMEIFLSQVHGGLFSISLNNLGHLNGFCCFFVPLRTEFSGRFTFSFRKSKAEDFKNW